MIQMNNPTESKKAGFTMIELLVVVSLSVILMLAASALFLSFLLNRTKITAIKQVKDEGQYALNRMEFMIRNALEIVPTANYPTGCEPDMSEIAIRSLDGEITRFFTEEDSSDGHVKIASNSGVYLTSATVTITDGVRFTCTQPGDGSTQHVRIFFALRRGTPGLSEAREMAQSEFQTAVSVRSF
jgi:prepilin-type N-terminal cleavage/methylation domain-containing protein